MQRLDEGGWAVLNLVSWRQPHCSEHISYACRSEVVIWAGTTLTSEQTQRVFTLECEYWDQRPFSLCRAA